MTTEEIISKANKIIHEHLLGNTHVLTPEDRFYEDLRADSLDMVELTMTFEDEFDIEITDDEAHGILTVGNAHDLLLEKTRGR